MPINSQVQLLVIGIVATIIFGALWMSYLLEKQPLDYKLERDQKDDVWKGVLSEDEISLMRQESELYEIKKRRLDAFNAGYQHGLKRFKKGNDES